MVEDSAVTGHASLAHRARRELINYLVVAFYLYVCFSAVLLYKAAVLHAEGINYAAVGVAAAKALILGKFMLIGDMMKVGRRRPPSRLALDIGLQSLAFLALLLLLTAVEELVVGLARGHGIADIVAETTGPRLPETLAASFLMLLILIPYIAFRTIDEELGAGTLKDLLITHRAQAGGGTGKAAPRPPSATP